MPLNSISPGFASTAALVVVNASNIHSGGGLQVAVSSLQELAALPKSDLRLSVVASSEVAAGLVRLGVDCSVFENFEVLDTYAWRGTTALRKRLRGADAVFTIFGPLYVAPKPALSVVGFAQAWIIYPRNAAYGLLPYFQRLRTRLHYFLKKLAFRLGSDAVFVEADHVRRGLVSEGIFRDDQITVVSNCVSTLYREPQLWTDVSMPAGSGDIKLGVVSRDYQHKNLDMIPDVKTILLREYGLNVDFVVTFNENEWAGKPDRFRNAVLNAGSLHVEQCPSFYSKLDGVFFPSLLESFSATPLEAMVMRKPLFASDRAFVRDFCNEFPWYFDPESPADAARAIADFILSAKDSNRIDAAYQHVLSLPGARQRAISYLTRIGSLVVERQAKRDLSSQERHPAAARK